MKPTILEVLDFTRKLTLEDLKNKTIFELAAKAGEEHGEFLRELQIEERVHGNTHKERGEDGTIGEAIDVIIMGLCLYFARQKNLHNQEDFNPDELSERIMRKLEKWENCRQGSV